MKNIRFAVRIAWEGLHGRGQQRGAAVAGHGNADDITSFPLTQRTLQQSPFSWSASPALQFRNSPEEDASEEFWNVELRQFSVHQRLHLLDGDVRLHKLAVL
jgi:hypothetical protein